MNPGRPRLRRAVATVKDEHRSPVVLDRHRGREYAAFAQVETGESRVPRFDEASNHGHLPPSRGFVERWLFPAVPGGPSLIDVLDPNTVRSTWSQIALRGVLRGVGERRPVALPKPALRGPPRPRFRVLGYCVSGYAPACAPFWLPVADNTRSRAMLTPAPPAKAIGCLSPLW